MPRVASLSGTTEVAPIRPRPSALIVARFRAMWLMVLLVWVTRSLAGIGHLPRSGLARHREAHGDATLGSDLLRRLEVAEGLDRGPDDVHRVGGAVDLGE